MRIPRIYTFNVNSDAQAGTELKIGTYVENENTVEHPADGLGDVATRTLSFRSGTDRRKMSTDKIKRESQFPLTRKQAPYPGKRRRLEQFA